MSDCSMLTSDSSLEEENFNDPVKESTCAFCKLLKVFPFLSGSLLNGEVVSYIYEFWSLSKFSIKLRLYKSSSPW